MQHHEEQLDMFEESKPREAAPPPRFPLTAIHNLPEMPSFIRPCTIVRINPTTILIWNE